MIDDIRLVAERRLEELFTELDRCEATVGDLRCVLDEVARQARGGLRAADAERALRKIEVLALAALAGCEQDAPPHDRATTSGLSAGHTPQ